MCTMCYLLFIACSLIMTNASILNDLQEAQKFVEQLDYDYSAVAADAAAQQRPAAAADLLWYDYGGGGGGGSISGGGGYYGVGGSTVPRTTAAQLMGADKRGGATQSSGGIWFGPRLGRRKRRGGIGGLVQPVDGNAVGPDGPQEPTAAAATAAGQSLVAGAWVFVPVIDNTIYNQMKQNVRSGRSSSEDGDDAASASRHAARSPPYSPPFSPRLGRQATAHGRPQVPRLGREASLYRRDARSALYQQNRPFGSPYHLSEQQHVLQQQQQPSSSSSSSAVTQSAQATAEARRHAGV